MRSAAVQASSRVSSGEGRASQATFGSTMAANGGEAGPAERRGGTVTRVPEPSPLIVAARRRASSGRRTQNPSLHGNAVPPTDQGIGQHGIARVEHADGGRRLSALAVDVYPGEGVATRAGGGRGPDRGCACPEARLPCPARTPMWTVDEVTLCRSSLRADALRAARRASEARAGERRARERPTLSPSHLPPARLSTGRARVDPIGTCSGRAGKAWPQCGQRVATLKARLPHCGHST